MLPVSPTFFEVENVHRPFPLAYNLVVIGGGPGAPDLLVVLLGADTLLALVFSLASAITYRVVIILMGG